MTDPRMMLLNARIADEEKIRRTEMIIMVICALGTIVFALFGPESWATTLITAFLGWATILCAILVYAVSLRISGLRLSRAELERNPHVHA